ncbi:transcriptional regulator [Streptomyces sp. TRM 70361]|uniref:transcriptional regulator n=1 Tax=Streptomyces sp. TRM 70361 TaxID=3116553 RepID=UPI002E7AD9A2|nr:transcriptional regulator [Streptomyces sp. TRM 70361]MEE1943005.1 transcriptional regulator [Streptomyces sp. TRM 70361]
MAGRWMRLGLYGADGIPGADALALGIEAMVTGVASPPDSERGIAARLRYLTTSPAGYAAMDRAGLSVTARTLFAWLAEERLPSAANRRRLDAAYWDLRRHNVAADLKRRLKAGGGTRIEIDPVDQTRVPAPHRRDVQVRRLTVRPRVWEAAVDAWLEEDYEALDAIWDDLIHDLGSDYDAYAHVSSVGWSA